MSCSSKRWVKSMWRREFTGLGHVFRFTLVQQLKNKANIASLVILLLLCLVSMPVTSMIGGGSFVSPSSFGADLSAVVLDNRTDLPIKADWSGSDFGYVSVSDVPVTELAPNVARLTFERGTEGYLITAEGGEEVSSIVVAELAARAQ